MIAFLLMLLLGAPGSGVSVECWGMELLGHPTDYDRGDWKHWIDEDGDCQNTRAETLVMHSVRPVRYATPRGCRVLTGVWVDVFSGETLFFAGEIDIDHIVPLGWAHDKGAADWDADRRRTFANDPDNLVPVHRSLNRQKGKKGPADWRPPSNLCGYATRWLHILRKYELMVTIAEVEALAEMQGHCENPGRYFE
ncbi:MAG: HNH endonuclease family protein [Nitrospirales bacterium]